MKKFLKVCTLVGLFVLAGCGNSNKPSEKIRLLTPQGATALATLNVYNNEYADVTSVAGSDVITAELAKEDAAYDVIIAPLNIGVKMIENDNTNYRLDSIITWGNLYVVGNDAYQEGEAIAAFGEQAVPGLVLRYVQPDVQASYFNSAQDVQAQLLGGKANAGLLAEPAVSATIAKAKENGIELKILENLQETYAEKSGSEIIGFPQAAIFVKEGSEKKAEGALKAIIDFTNNTKGTEEELLPLIEHAGIENLGIPNAKIAIQSWARQNIKYVNADEVKEEITAFLKLFNLTYDENMVSK